MKKGDQYQIPATFSVKKIGSIKAFLIFSWEF